MRAIKEHGLLLHGRWGSQPCEGCEACPCVGLRCAFGKLRRLFPGRVCVCVCGTETAVVGQPMATKTAVAGQPTTTKTAVVGQPTTTETAVVGQPMKTE